MKELAEFTFDELVDHYTWKVIQAIVSGEKLRTAIFTVLDLAVRWRKEND